MRGWGWGGVGVVRVTICTKDRGGRREGIEVLVIRRENSSVFCVMACAFFSLCGGVFFWAMVCWVWRVSLAGSLQIISTHIHLLCTY